MKRYLVTALILGAGIWQAGVAAAAPRLRPIYREGEVLTRIAPGADVRAALTAAGAEVSGPADRQGWR